MSHAKKPRRTRSHPAPVSPFDTVAASPVADVMRVAGEMARAAGPRDATPWVGDLSGVLRGTRR